MAKYTAEQLDALKSKGHTFPGGTSYPIDDAEDLDNAIHAVGRGGVDHDAIRKYIIGRAKALGLSSKIPDNWNTDGSLRSDLGLETDTFTRERFWTATDLEVRSDGRTVYGLCVPFDQVATVNDGRGNYQEMFKRGAFAKTIQENGHRVKLMATHDHRRFPLGRATDLHEDPAGLVGEFHVSNTRDGDEAIQLVHDRVLDSFSVGFRPVKHRRNDQGVVERQEVGLREVSLLAFPAYAGAAVAGVRAMDAIPTNADASYEPTAYPASFSVPILTGAMTHNGYGAFDMTLVSASTNSPDTPAEEAAEGTSAPRAATFTEEPVRHSKDVRRHAKAWLINHS